MHEFNDETFTLFTQEEWDNILNKNHFMFKGCNHAAEHILLIISFSDACPDISERIKNDKTLESLKIYMDQAYKHQENEYAKSRRLTGDACGTQENIAYMHYCIYQQKKRDYDTALLGFIKKLVPETPVVIRSRIVAYQFKDVKAVNPWTTTIKK